MSEKLFTKDKCMQILVGVASGIANIPHGIAITFPSTAFPQMALPDSDLKPTRDESALIAAILVYAMSSSLIAGPLMDFIGRKRVLIVMTIPLTIGIALVASATSPAMIIVGRALVGSAIGISIPVGYVYASETTEASMRGFVGSIHSVLYATGCLIGYFLKLVTYSWRTSAWIGMAPPLLLLLILLFTPSSPRFLLMKGKTIEALSELKRLRGPDESQLEKEFTSIQEYFTKETKKPNIFHALWRNNALVGKLFFLGFLLGCSGGTLIMGFAELFLSNLGVTLSKELLAFGIGAVNLIGTLVSMLTTDRLGRKPLLLICGICMTSGWALLTAFSYFSLQEYMTSEWMEYIPFAIISLIIFAFSFGYRTVIFVVASESFPTEIRGVGTSTMQVWACVSLGILNHSFIYVLHYIGMSGTCLVFTCINIIGILFCMFAIKESGGKSLEAMNKEE